MSIAEIVEQRIKQVSDLISQAGKKVLSFAKKNSVKAMAIAPIATATFLTAPAQEAKAETEFHLSVGVGLGTPAICPVSAYYPSVIYTAPYDYRYMRSYPLYRSVPVYRTAPIYRSVPAPRPRIERGPATPRPRLGSTPRNVSRQPVRRAPLPTRSRSR